MELKFIENLDEVLVIDIDKIGIPNSPELSEWFLINSIRLRVGSLPKPLCTRNHQLINLSDLQTAAEQSIWLQKNSKFICFSKSYPNIEKVHKIENNPAQIKIINDKITKNDKVSLSVSELLAIMYNYNLDSYNYEKYLVFEIIDKKLNINIVDLYDEKKDCFSFPFFKSILINNNETNLDRCIFHFVETDINGKTIAIRVDFSDNKLPIHYDYSHNPPNGRSWNFPINIRKNSF